MIQMQTIADAIRAEIPELREVGTAKDLGRLSDETVVCPSAYVVLLGERSGANRYQSCGLLDQRVTLRFGVVLAVRDIGVRLGEGAISEIELMRNRIVTFLGALQMPGAEDVCLPIRGTLLGGVNKRGQMFWQDDFTIETNRRIQGSSP